MKIFLKIYFVVESILDCWENYFRLLGDLFLIVGRIDLDCTSKIRIELCTFELKTYLRIWLLVMHHLIALDLDLRLSSMI